MSAETISRTVRFKRPEVEKIDEFLEKNPVFDFSTLTRIALLEFIKHPTLEIRAVKTKRKVAPGPTASRETL